MFFNVSSNEGFSAIREAMYTIRVNSVIELKLQALLPKYLLNLTQRFSQ